MGNNILKQESWGAEERIGGKCWFRVSHSVCLGASLQAKLSLLQLMPESKEMIINNNNNEEEEKEEEQEVSWIKTRIILFKFL